MTGSIDTIMDVSDLRKRILRALEEARTDAAARRATIDEAARAYEGFLENIAVPLARQAVQVLNGSGNPFAVNTPAGTVRIVSDNSPLTFIEIALDTTGAEPTVIGRVSLTRGRQGQVVEERPVVAGKGIAQITEENLSAFFVAEIPRLIVKS